ncbi:hypothetical protein [uncultured Jatrophihabitans sp.]|uniref:hypothetical protein n=1 Tax=uncultured Jatrophihabitans sp. TaxID=1610747 RepID=UPI0035CA68F1
MSDAALALIAALAAAALTGLSSLGVVWFQERLRGKAEDADALIRVVTEMLARSLAMALRARTLGDAAKLRSGVGEGLDILFRIKKPIEPLELHDWLQQDYGPLNAAWSDILSRGDRKVVTSANRVMIACGVLMSAATDIQPAFGATAKLRRTVAGEKWTTEMLGALSAAQKDLEQARKNLIMVARDKLGRDVIDPFG